MSKTATAIAAANAAGRAALIGYLPLGYPDTATSIAAAIELANAGADVLELGPPYSDPVMDGAVIQEATVTALAQGFRTADVFPAVSQIVAATGKPVLVMVYWNLVLQYGVAKFAKELAACGGAGLIIPDITPENANEWLSAAAEYDLDRVFLAAHTSSDLRLERIVAASRGFVYAVSTMGVTGERTELDASAADLVKRLKAAGAAHVCVGIGVSSPEHVRAIAGYADGAIVGTALVKALKADGVTGVRDLTSKLTAGLER